MRIKLKRGYQKRLIYAAKRNLTWEEIAEKLKISQNYFCHDLKNEKVLISDKLYKQLCRISNKNFDKFINSKLSNNWGQSKGGKNSRGSLINLKVSYNRLALAELIGIILGDGNINYYKKGKKTGVYQVKIAGDFTKDKDYHLNYIKPLCESLFNIDVKEIINPKHGERVLVLSSKELVKFLVKKGLKPGNKIVNQVSIPKWIFNGVNYLKLCIRGLLDTDGSIFRMSKKDPNLIRINFRNNNKRLIIDTRKAFMKLGFHPSKIIGGNTINLSRQEEIKKYVREIGFKNQKHFSKLPEFKIAL